MKYDDYTTKQSDVSFAGSINFVFNLIAGNSEDNAIALGKYIVKTTLDQDFHFASANEGILIVEDEFDFNDAEKLQSKTRRLGTK